MSEPKRLRASTLLIRLVAIVLLAMLPAVLVLVNFQSEVQANRQVQARAVALRQAELLNASLGATVEGARQLLTTVTHLDQVQGFDPGCGSVLAALQRDLSSYVFIAVTDEQGGLICASTGAPPAPGDLRAMAAESRQTGHFMTGAFMPSASGQPAYLSFGLPFTAAAGGRRGVVIAGLQVAWLDGFLTAVKRPAGGIFSVVDRNGIVLARQPDPARYVGRQVLPAVRALIGGPEAGTAIVPGFEGKERIIGYVPNTIEPVGLYVSAGFLVEDLTKDIDAAAWRGYVMIAACAALSLVVALLAGRRFVQAPARALLRAAEGLGSGDLSVRATLPKGAAREFFDIGAAFNAMAATLERQRRDLQALNDALETRVEQRTRALSESHDRLQREIAEREATEERLRQVQKLQAVGQLASGIAHDFNNLLTAIQGSLELLRRRIMPGDHPPLRLLDMANAAVERGARLTGKLLSFSREQPLLSVPIDLAGAIEGMAGLLTSTLGAAIWTEIKLDPDLWPVAIDPNQFETAILNLALNARDAMPGGGRLQITAQNLLIDAAQATPAIPAGAYVSITVSDSGSGMSDEVQARAFEPFFTTRAVGEGAGLGLSQVHGLVRQAGGDVRIGSRPGAGTRVTMLLPRTMEEPVRYARAAPLAVERSGPERTILLVDDDADVREITAALLSESGYIVVQAKDGPDALACLADAATPIGFMIADYAMPGMSGQALLSRVREMRPDLPALLVSGYADFTALTQDGLLADQIMRKPFRSNELLARIEMIWERERRPVL